MRPRSSVLQGTVTAVVCALLLLTNVQPLAGQQKTSHQLQVEMKQREIKQKMEQSKRESEFRQRKMEEKLKQGAVANSTTSTSVSSSNTTERAKHAAAETRQRIAEANDNRLKYDW